MDATVIAVISTLISSIALVGVAISLLLQARQLRTSQFQAARAAQSELIRIALDNQTLISDTVGEADPDAFVKSVYLNWRFKYMELGYLMKTMSASSVRLQAAMLFDAQYPRYWWVKAQKVYSTEATAKREREFVTIVEEAFEQAVRLHEPAVSRDSERSKTTPPPSSR